MGHAAFKAHDPTGGRLPDLELPAESDHRTALARLLDWLTKQTGSLVAVGHRVVHGGQRFSTPLRVDQASLAELNLLVPLAPLHQPHNLAAIQALLDAQPELPQIACFDTAFHSRLPSVARNFALPAELTDAGVHRYGFHGLSYEYIASVLPSVAGEQARRRIVVAHLGNGASLCALKNRQSVDTTMGLTALDGLPMGTRCGSLDPGVVLYLIAVENMPVGAVNDILYNRSGLLGVSGISNDMRTLLASTDPRAQAAVDLYVYRLKRELGALIGALEGLDGLVFTGGIGENAAPIRARLCESLQWLGVSIDLDANQANASCISHASSTIPVWVIPTNEELMIARHALALLDA